MKVNRATRKGGLQASGSGSVKRHSAQPPAINALSQSGKLDLLDDLSTSTSERASLEALLPFLHERVAFKIPSDVRYLDSVLDYLNERMLKLGLVDSDESQVLIALDEAIVNAIKHGNKGDSGKAVSIVAEFSANEACFTVADEGAGFAREEVPDPTDPLRLLEPCGRGLLLINHIMDEVCYNKSGNEIRMIKRAKPAGDGETLAGE